MSERVEWTTTEPVERRYELRVTLRDSTGHAREVRAATPADILAAAAANPDLREALVAWAAALRGGLWDGQERRHKVERKQWETRCAELTAERDELRQQQAMRLDAIRDAARTRVAESALTALRERYDELSRAVCEWLHGSKGLGFRTEQRLEAIARALDVAPAATSPERPDNWRPAVGMRARIRGSIGGGGEGAIGDVSGRRAKFVGSSVWWDFDQLMPTESPAQPGEVPDPKPTGDPARDVQTHGGTCWLIEDKRGVYRGTWWFSRRPWEDDETVSWTTNASSALAFPTQAEAIMFAREYLPELEGKYEVTEHGFTAGKKGDPTPPVIPDRSSGAVEGPSKASPLPWRVGVAGARDGKEEATDVRDADGDIVSRCVVLGDAEFIVSRCNAQPDPDAVRRETAQRLLSKYPRCFECDEPARRESRIGRVFCLQHQMTNSTDVPWLVALEAAEAAAGGERG